MLHVHRSVNMSSPAEKVHPHSTYSTLYIYRQSNSRRLVLLCLIFIILLPISTIDITSVGDHLHSIGITSTSFSAEFSTLARITLYTCTTLPSSSSSYYHHNHHHHHHHHHHQQQQQQQPANLLTKNVCSYQTVLRATCQFIKAHGVLPGNAATHPSAL